MKPGFLFLVVISFLKGNQSLYFSSLFYSASSRPTIGGNGKLYAPCGVFEDAFSSPATNFAKADNQKR
jgi:hypothetical protein